MAPEILELLGEEAVLFGGYILKLKTITKKNKNGVSMILQCVSGGTELKMGHKKGVAVLIFVQTVITDQSIALLDGDKKTTAVNPKPEFKSVTKKKKPEFKSGEIPFQF